MNTKLFLARLGALVYVVWGLFHFMAAYAVYKLADSVTAGMVQARLMQTAFYLVCFALAGIVIALTLNWKNDKNGFWINGLLLGIADIPFVAFVLVPGLIPFWPGVIGPLLFVIALLLTYVARGTSASAVAAREDAHPSRT